MYVILVAMSDYYIYIYIYILLAVMIEFVCYRETLLKRPEDIRDFAAGR